jgi:rhodanese-related sulfurtransferase
MSKKQHTSKTESPSKAAQRQRGARRPNRKGWWIGLAVGVVVLIGAAILLLRPKSALPSEISATQAYETYQQGAFFLDVRTQEEWNQGHIAKSTLIPLDSLQGLLSEVPRDQDIVVVCRSGVRSKEGAAILREAGFTRVTCMTGGLQAWVAAGYPLTN